MANDAHDDHGHGGHAHSAQMYYITYAVLCGVHDPDVHCRAA